MTSTLEVSATSGREGSKADKPTVLGPFEDKKGGWSLRMRSKNDGDYTVPLTTTAVRVVKDISEDDGLAVHKKWKVSGKRPDTGKMHTAEIDGAEYSQVSEWLRANWGIGAYVCGDYGDKKVLQVIASQSKPECETRYTHTGWREIDGKWCFLHAGGALGAEGQNISLDGRERLSMYRLPSKPEDVEEAIKASLASLELHDKSMTLPLWLCMYAAPLATMVGLKMLLLVIGRTNSFKSGLTGIQMLHYGSGFRYDRLTDAFSSSEAYLMRGMFMLKDLPYVIDEMTPGTKKDLHEQYKQKMHNIAFSVANGQVSGRSNPDGTTRSEAYPRGLVIVLGEENLVDMEGQNTRAFAVNVKPVDEKDADTLVRDLTTFEAEQGARLPHAMSAYIQWLQKHRDYIIKEFPSILTQQNEQWTETLKGRGVKPRLKNTLAIYTAVLGMVLQFFQEYGVEDDTLNATARKVFTDLALEHSAHTEALSPLASFKETLGALIGGKKAYLEHRTERANPFAQGNGALLGYEDAEFFYIFPITFEMLARANGMPLTHGHKEVGRQLKAAGVTKCHGQGHTTFILTMAGAKSRVWAIDKEKVGLSSNVFNPAGFEDDDDDEEAGED